MKLKLVKLPHGQTELVVMLSCSKEEANGLRASGQALPPKMPFPKAIAIGEVVTVDPAIGHRILGSYYGSFEVVSEGSAKEDKAPNAPASNKVAEPRATK